MSDERPDVVRVEFVDPGEIIPELTVGEVRDIRQVQRERGTIDGLGTCGTCGSHTLIIGSTWDATHGLYVWVIRCPNGHPLVPIPSNVYTINFGTEERG